MAPRIWFIPKQILFFSTDGTEKGKEEIEFGPTLLLEEAAHCYKLRADSDCLKSVQAGIMTHERNIPTNEKRNKSIERGSRSVHAEDTKHNTKTAKEVIID